MSLVKKLGVTKFWASWWRSSSITMHRTSLLCHCNQCHWAGALIENWIRNWRRQDIRNLGSDGTSKRLTEWQERGREGGRDLSPWPRRLPPTLEGLISQACALLRAGRLLGYIIKGALEGFLAKPNANENAKRAWAWIRCSFRIR